MSLSVFTCNRIWISARPDITYLLLQPTLQLKQTMSGPVMKLFWKCWLFHLQIWLKLWLCKKNIYQKCIGNTTEDKIYWMIPNYITSIMNSALFFDKQWQLFFHFNVNKCLIHHHLPVHMRLYTRAQLLFSIHCYIQLPFTCLLVILSPKITRQEKRSI